VKRWAALLLPSLLGGCALGPLPAPGASIHTIELVAASALPPIAVGRFTAAPAVARDDRAIPIRASTIRPPNGSFARYLGDMLTAQLRTAGKLDPSAALVLSGTLLRNHATTTIGTAHAELAAEFVLTRGNRILYRKTQEVSRAWDSSFFAVQALPAATASYNSLYPALIEKLVADPDFVAAARTP